MDSSKLQPHAISRRAFMALSSGLALSQLPGLAQAAQPGTGTGAQVSTAKFNSRKQRPNVLFVFTDQERYLDNLPIGFARPGHEKLMRQGVTFHNHYCPAVMCTSSRAVMLTGLQTPDNRMFENTDMPYVKALSTQVPTIGHMLRKAGYYTAYKGKWHLNKDFDTDTPTRLFDKEMDAYGFSDFAWPGDVLTHSLGGYKHDHMIADSAVSWLREKGQQLNADGTPWAMVVSLVNPHDIMYFNTDRPGESVQDNGRLLMPATRAPLHPMYAKKWQAKLPATLGQPLDGAGRPSAHAEFNKAWGYTLGTIPMEEVRWQRFNDFYFNSLQAVDTQLLKLLDELDALNLSGNTIVVFTADHGEMGGAHGLRGKGPFAYQEAIHLPLLISHPDVNGGQHCNALTGHIDLTPTLLSLCGVTETQAAEFAGRKLPGKSLSPLFGSPQNAGLHAVRDNILFTYSGIATNDSEMIRLVSEAKAAGKDPKTAIQAMGYRPNLKKRGSLRTVFDGRHKFTRYFAPVDRNRPANLDELFRWNDVELFDLKTDPSEVTNLATAPTANAALLMAMNQKLESAIKAEIGVDDGREMPEVDRINWNIERLDL
ncbi:sulfatase-like hydrolase/transferase [Crenobacter caeni]|uniref:Sulfatase-like hydrolase/transferase n=1 Tax=Crenobacter caeni TaxID=2705474 RepID=A0A6B2KSZ5_9NEIS|nr:sulfatase-like hydrolase/transferase [Crenobacter caeni]NDV13163.1 sulfatase-like hydrolase/transferase [Crenobacter caeni]